MIKGLRSAKSKRLGTLQPFALIGFDHIPGKGHSGLGKLTTTKFIAAPDRTDPVIAAELALLAEVSDRFLEFGQVIPNVFELWEAFLHLKFSKPIEETCGFLVRFFTSLGLFPDFQHCVRCGQKFSATKNIRWEIGAGVSCCGEVAAAFARENEQTLNFAQLKSLFFWQHAAPESFAQLLLNGKERTALFALILRAVQHFSPQPFRAQKVFGELLSL